MGLWWTNNDEVLRLTNENATLRGERDMLDRELQHTAAQRDRAETRVAELEKKLLEVLLAGDLTPPAPPTAEDELARAIREGGIGGTTRLDRIRQKQMDAFNEKQAALTRAAQADQAAGFLS